MSDNDLAGWDFAGQNLTGADFEDTILSDADFTGAVVSGAYFGFTTSRGFTPEQFYSTASYQSGDLSRINLSGNDLSGWNFAGRDLTRAYFYDATLTDADFSGANLTRARFYRAALTGADFRGANFMGADLRDADLSFSDLRGALVVDSQLASAASTEGTVLPDGRIEGLALDAGERLVVRDYNGEEAIPITVESVMSLDPAAALRMVFATNGRGFVDGVWGSTISFEAGVPVSLEGALELLFADDTNPTDLIGTTFDLFDWDGAVLSGTFGDEIVTEAEAIWDTSSLYTTGEVTLLSAVPEPSTLMLLGVGAMILLAGVVRFRRGIRESTTIPYSATAYSTDLGFSIRPEASRISRPTTLPSLS